MATTLPEEIVEEILLRVAADEPVHLVHAALVCKVWRRILSDHGFLRRYCRFHGTPPLLGFIYNHITDSNLQFVPTTCIASASRIRMPAFDANAWTLSALDCRHGRVLIQAEEHSTSAHSLIVWDPITGDEQHLDMPDYSLFPYPHHLAGTVLCTKKDGCDHLDCHNGPFLVVLLGMGFDDNYDLRNPSFEIDDIHNCGGVYSSETGAWSARTTIDIRNGYIDQTRPSLLIRDALYFTIIGRGRSIKYDLCKNELSMVHLPGGSCCRPILIKEDDGGLGVAAILQNCVCMWSWQVGIKGVGEWVKYRVMELDDTLLSKGFYQRGNLICMVDGTNTVFIAIENKGIFMLDIKSKQVRKIVGKIKTRFNWIILPYISPYISSSTPVY